MSKKNTPAAPAATPAAPVLLMLTTQQANDVREQAGALATADKTFADAISSISTAVARIMGVEPSYDHWTLVQTAFVKDYATARGVKEESARMRWVRVADAMEKAFALVKPAKPTKAAEVKAVQRAKADDEATALIMRAKATTPDAIMRIAAKGGIAPGVSAALTKAAGALAKDAAKAANEAAREESKTLRESIRKETQTLDVTQLRRVAKLIADMKSAALGANMITGAAADVGQGNSDAEQEEPVDAE